MNTALGLLVTAILLPIASAAPDTPADTLTLENAHVRRVLKLNDHVWRTDLIERADHSDAVRISSDEFLIQMVDGARLTVADYRCADSPKVEANGKSQTVTIRYEPRHPLPAGAPTTVVIEYWLGNDAILRKQVDLHLPEQSAVDRLEVERFRPSAPCRHGGKGEPVFIDNKWFVGLEYPGGESKEVDGLVSLTHFPGLAQQQPDEHWAIQSKTAVAGIGNVSDPVELGFSDYLDTIRRPSRRLLHYNSWYDFRGRELTPTALLDTYEAFRKNVLQPYDLTMDVFVPDDGWQNPQSIWEPLKDLYPEGFGPLARALESKGTRFGLWIPFNGFNLDVAWGEKQGFEKSNQGRFYCLVGPKYNHAFRNAIEKITKEGDVAYYKHDFNQLQCSAAGHGHLPDLRHGHEANLDAELDLLAYERQLKPDIYLNVTSYVWHSPWWLMHADSIWMAAGDSGYNRDWPQLSPREWAMSYRDAHFHKLYRERDTLVPLSAMMTHGLIDGRYERLGGSEETLREWSDYVVLYYGRGVQLMEWYLTPSLLSKERWDVLGKATQWATDNRKVLENVVMVGGDPRLGEPYGFVHWLDDHGVLVLRNPDVREQSITVPFDKSVRYRGPKSRTFHGRIVYPYIESLADTYTSGSPISITVPGCSVLVCELDTAERKSPKPLAPPPPPDAKGQVVRGPDGLERVTTRIDVPDEPMQRCDLYFTIRSDAALPTSANVTLDDQPVHAREGRGSDWIIYSVDLSKHRGQSVSATFRLGDAGSPFGVAEGKVSAWLVMDRTVPGAIAAEPMGHLPRPISSGFRRQTHELLPESKLEGRRNSHTISSELLRSAPAAKLRIIVFDSNPEPAYRNKQILLNGVHIADVPANTGTLSAWETHTIDLKPDVIARLSNRNTLEVTNPGGDYFKFSGVALAIQSADGQWIETIPNNRAFSSTANWAYAEGTPFTGNRSGPITLQFTQQQNEPGHG